MSEHRCPRCNTPVVIPKGRPGGICKNCRRAVLLEELEQKPDTGFLYLRLFLILVVLASCGLLFFYVLQQTTGFTPTERISFAEITVSIVEYLLPEPGVGMQGEPHARNVSPRKFSLWELHSNDTVRMVDVITDPSKKGQTVRVSGPLLRANDKILSEQIIGGSLSRRTVNEEDYRGRTYIRPSFSIQSNFDTVGYDMWAKTPPHLHINGDARLISIGVDPKNYQQEIIAVAIPVDSRIILISDYQPYRHKAMGDWDVFYYDVSDIRRHISIHITYRPDGKAGPLDWPNVELRR
jgi:hypothetical protein